MCNLFHSIFNFFLSNYELGFCTNISNIFQCFNVLFTHNISIWSWTKWREVSWKCNNIISAHIKLFFGDTEKIRNLKKNETLRRHKIWKFTSFCFNILVRLESFVCLELSHIETISLDFMTWKRVASKDWNNSIKGGVSTCSHCSRV